MTLLIKLDGEVVATVGATRYFVAPRIEALPPDDQVGRLVTLMCAFALDVQAGRREGPYRDAEALRAARAVLEGGRNHPGSCPGHAPRTTKPSPARHSL